MHTNPRAIAALVLLAIGLSPGLVLGSVKVVKEPAVIATRTFDPSHPPKDMPKLGEGEDAFTDCNYRCELNCKFRTVESKKTDDGVEVVVKIYAVIITTRLKVTIWIPNNAPAKLVAHEQGHRQISEQIYENAEKVAKSVASKIDERRVVGRGESEQSAKQSAVTDLSRDTTKGYLDETLAKASRVNEIYDELTAHGTRQEPAEPEAIKLAFEQYMKEKQATTKPTK